MKIKNIETYNDERADRFFDIFSGLEGQITISAIKPLQFSGWHKHELQTDWFSVVKGRVKVAVISPSSAAAVANWCTSAVKELTVEFPRNLQKPTLFILNLSAALTPNLK